MDNELVLKKRQAYKEMAAAGQERYKNTVRLYRGAAVKLDEQKLDTYAQKRTAHALGAELGLKPEDVDRIVAMARSEMGPKDLTALAKESGADAAAKAKPYLEKVLAYKEA